MKLSDLRAGLITAERIPLLFYIVGYLLSLSANINSNWLQHNAAARWLLALVVPLAILTLLAPPIVRRFLPLSPVPTARQHRAGECQGLVALVSSGDGAATARKAIEYHAATLRRIWLVHSPDSAAEADKLVDDLSRHERLSVRHFEKISLTDKAFGDPEAVRDAIEERVYRRLADIMPPIPQSEVVVNIMGGMKQTTAGAFLAALAPGRRIEVVPALTRDDRLRGMTPGDPLEIEIHYTLKRGSGS